VHAASLAAGFARASARRPCCAPYLLPCMNHSQPQRAAQRVLCCCSAPCLEWMTGRPVLAVAPPASRGAPRRQGLRPHVFGMTASPLDAKLGQAAERVGAFFRELEANLDARVRRATQPNPICAFGHCGLHQSGSAELEANLDAWVRRSVHQTCALGYCGLRQLGSAHSAPRASWPASVRPPGARGALRWKAWPRVCAHRR